MSEDFDPLETGEKPLAAVVAKPQVDEAMAEFRAAGVYDDDRRLREFGEDRVAIPVTDPPQSTLVREVVRQEPDRRLRTLEDHLRERGWSDEELARAPGSWAVIGDVVLVDIEGSPRPGEVGEALLSLQGNADTVLARHGISGQQREPDVEVIAGSGDTETVHTEHGTKYALDLAQVMFSPGNKAERVRMGETVDNDERVFDMFAGVGYFTLPMARGGAQITATEINPTAFRYLLENAKLNDVGDRVDIYRSDCRDVAGSVEADRVVMGYYDAFEYLNSALDAVTAGGVVHMHEATPEPLVFERPIERLEDAAGERGRQVDVLDTRRVKTHSEGVVHVVVDARID